MGGRRDYTRWDYDDETEITMEEQLTLEENPDNGSLAGVADTLSNNARFPPPSVLMSSSSPLRSRETSCKRSRNTSIKEKAQLFALSAVVLLVGFITGFGIGVRDRGSQISSRHSKHYSAISDPNSGYSHDHNNRDFIFHELLPKVSAKNIRKNLQKMTQEEHLAGSPEGKSMAMTIRDLWRSYGISVLMEQHKTLLTKTESFNYVQVISSNGTVLFTTSKVGDDVNSLNSRPIMAFSPPADLNGTLVYSNYGRLEDFMFLKKSGIALKGAIALVRFGELQPSNVASIASGLGLGGLIFYPDPIDFGPKLSKKAVKSSSLLHVGQVQDYQKRNGNGMIPSHTISALDAETLFSTMEKTPLAPDNWQGTLATKYHLGGGRKETNVDGGQVRLKISNEAKMSSIYNVVAAIPGSMESDRYVVLGCSHDSWAGNGAGDPGIGLAITTELLRAFSASLEAGWKPRRSILFVSWDANLFASSGMSHWLQEHHFEIMTRAVAYIDLTRALQGNHTLDVFSSPLLKEVVRKAINKIKHKSIDLPEEDKMLIGFPTVQWNSAVSSDLPSYEFLGNLGIPFIRLCATNTPKEYAYPLFHTALDTFDNFEAQVDPDFRASEALGRVIAEIIVLLADSSAEPIALHDYVKEIRKEFDHLMAEYHDDFLKANLSYDSLQAAVMKLQYTGESFKAQVKNGNRANDPDFSLSGPHRKLRKEMNHRILNDKLLNVEKALLSRSGDSKDDYKHQIIGHSRNTFVPEPPLKGSTEAGKESPHDSSSNSTSSSGSKNKNKLWKGDRKKKKWRKVFSSSSAEHFGSQSQQHFFPKLRAVLECGRSCSEKLYDGDVCTDFYLFSKQFISQEVSLSSSSSQGMSDVTTGCSHWQSVATERISSLVRSLDAVSAILQSPLVTQTHE